MLNTLWRLTVSLLAIASTVIAAPPKIYKTALKNSWLFYEAQRTGKLPASNRILWRRDAILDDVSPSGRCAVGGHVDAGDNVFFGFPYGSTASVLAWSVVEFHAGHKNSGQLLHAYDNLKWFTDFIMQCYISDDEILVALGDPNYDHSQWRRVEDVTEQRKPYSISRSSPGSDITGAYAAALASASVVFKDVDSRYSARLLDSARTYYNHAVRYAGIYSQSVPVMQQFYNSTGSLDFVALAAYWLGIRTGDSSFLQQSYTYLQQYVSENGQPWPLPSWGNAYHWVILALSHSHPDLTTNVSYVLDSWKNGLNGISYTPSGLAWGFQWGSLRYTMNAAAFVLGYADKLPAGSQRSELICWAVGQVDWVLGLTSKNQRSFLVGMGNNAPCHESHRSASCPDIPQSCGWDQYNSPDCNGHVLTGGLVGGPDQNDNFNDARANYQQDEPALDFNSGWTASLAALLTMSADVASCAQS